MVCDDHYVWVWMCCLCHPFPIYLNGRYHGCQMICLAILCRGSKGSVTSVSDMSLHIDVICVGKAKKALVNMLYKI